MKNKLILALTVAIATPCLAPVEYDLRKGIDMTGVSRITASQLNQLVDAGTVATNKGMVMRSLLKPNVTDNSRYTNFLWLDISLGVPGTLKQYVCCGDNATNWVTTAAGANSIGAAQLEDFLISSNKLGSNSVYFFHITTNAVITYHIQDGAVTTAKIGALAVDGTKIAGNTVSNAHLAANAVRATNIVDGSIDNTELATGAAIANVGVGGVLSNNIALNSIGTNHFASFIRSNLISSWCVITNISSGAVSILKGYNVSGVVKSSSGYLTITFATPYSDIDYALFVTRATTGDTSQSPTNIVIHIVRSNTVSTATVRQITPNVGNVGSDEDCKVYIQVIGQ